MAYWRRPMVFRQQGDDAGGEEGGGGGATVPKSRLDQEIRKRKTAQTALAQRDQELSDAREQIETLEAQAASSEGAMATITELRAENERLKSAHAEDMAIVRSGFDDAELLRFEHGRSDHEGSLSEWLEQCKAEPDKAPSHMREQFRKASGATEGAEGKTDGAETAEAKPKGTTSRDAGATPATGTETGPASLAERAKLLKNDPNGLAEWRKIRTGEQS